MTKDKEGRTDGGHVWRLGTQMEKNNKVKEEEFTSHHLVHVCLRQKDATLTSVKRTTNGGQGRTREDTEVWLREKNSDGEVLAHKRGQGRQRDTA